MYPAVAPALIIVGVLMMAPLRKIDWDDLTEALPAFFTMAVMVFGFAIHKGIAAGVMTHVAIHVLTGRGRQVHWFLYLVTGILVGGYLARS